MKYVKQIRNVMLSFVLLGAFALLSGCNAISSAPENSSKTNLEYEKAAAPKSVPSDEGNATDVDEEIRKLVDSDDFDAASIEKRKDMAEELLIRFEEDGKVRSYFYDDDTQMFSFVYADGIQGAIQLTSFDPMMN